MLRLRRGTFNQNFMILFLKVYFRYDADLEKYVMHLLNMLEQGQQDNHELQRSLKEANHQIKNLQAELSASQKMTYRLKSGLAVCGNAKQQCDQNLQKSEQEVLQCKQQVTKLGISLP